MKNPYLSETVRRIMPSPRIFGIGLMCLAGMLGVADAAGDKKPATPEQTAIERKLDTINVPQVNIEDAAVPEAVDFMRMRSVELDAAVPDPAKRGVQFVVIQPPRDMDALPVHAPKLEIKKTKITLRDLLVEICVGAGLAFHVDDHAVVIHPAWMEGAGKVPAVQGPAAEFAAETALRRVEIEMATLQEAVDLLNQEAARAAGKGKVFPIVIGEGVKATTRSGTVRLRGVPLANVLSYTLDGMGLTWTADEKEIRIRGK